MHYTQTLAAVAAFSSLAAAAPNMRSKFTIKQQATGKMHHRNGPAAYKAALAKYGAPVPNAVESGVKAVQSGTVEADPTQYDSQYLSPVTVGGQQLMLDFDTGSADLWCFSTELPSNEVNGQATYDPSISGQKMDGASWQIVYGDQSGAQGDVYSDTVEIGGVTATSQAVEAATSVSAQFSQDQANDGLVGFAFSKINTVQPQQQNTWFDTIKGDLPSQLFTVTLKHNTPGTYDFGFIDSSKYTGDIAYTPVDNSQGFWSFTADGYSVGSNSNSQSLSAIADTGTSLILVSDDVTSAYWGQVQSAQNSQQLGGYVFDCNDSLPDFSLTVGSNSLLVPGTYMNFAPNGDGTCFGGIQSSGGIGFNIFGDVFLKNQFVVFDDGNMQLGFASQAGGATNSTANLFKPRWARV